MKDMLWIVTNFSRINESTFVQITESEGRTYIERTGLPGTNRTIYDIMFVDCFSYRMSFLSYLEIYFRSFFCSTDHSFFLFSLRRSLLPSYLVSFLLYFFPSLLPSFSPSSFTLIMNVRFLISFKVTFLCSLDITRVSLTWWDNLEFLVMGVLYRKTVRLDFFRVPERLKGTEMVWVVERVSPASRK